MTKQRIDEVEPVAPKVATSFFWVALMGMVSLVVLGQIYALATTSPSDVLSEVKAMRTEITERTKDRIYRSEFEAFLKANPELKPPAGWEE